MSETRHRYGDVREDGKVFVSYSKSCRNGERWVTPERFALMKLNAKVRYYERKAERDDATPQEHGKKRAVTLQTNPALRIRSYAPRPSRRGIRILSPEQIALLPYGPDAPSATCLDELTPIPNYDGYGVTSNGAVHRMNTPTIGRNAFLPLPRITPSIAPRTAEWAVQLKCFDGKYHRVPIRHLMERAFGSGQTNS